jgi:phosphatidylglycerophosphate synthase
MAMPELLIALVTAHLISDFIVQTDGMVARKREKASRLGAVTLHVLATMIVLAILVLPAKGTAENWTVYGLIVLITGVTHFITDLAKEGLQSRAIGRVSGSASKSGSEDVRDARVRAKAFIYDQLAHLAVIIGLTLAFGSYTPDPVFGFLGVEATYFTQTDYQITLIAISTIITGVFVGGHLIGLLTDTLSDRAGGAVARDDEGLTGGGKIIGWLERAIVIGLVFAGEIGAIGFVIAAKSILRFGDVGPRSDQASADRHKVEYIIIGTFMSFGWALLVAGLGVWTINRWISPF